MIRRRSRGPGNYPTSRSGARTARACRTCAPRSGGHSSRCSCSPAPCSLWPASSSRLCSSGHRRCSPYPAAARSTLCAVQHTRTRAPAAPVFALLHAGIRARHCGLCRPTWADGAAEAHALLAAARPLPPPPPHPLVSRASSGGTALAAVRPVRPHGTEPPAAPCCRLPFTATYVGSMVLTLHAGWWRVPAWPVPGRCPISGRVGLGAQAADRRAQLLSSLEARGRRSIVEAIFRPPGTPRWSRRATCSSSSSRACR